METTASLVSLQAHRDQRTATITLPARFDVHEVEAFYASLRSHLAAGCASVVIDATGTRHLDHAGLDTLVEAQGEISSQGRHIHIAASTTLRVLCELVGSDLLDTDAAMQNEMAVAA